MKIRAEVTKVQTTGDGLRVTMQGKPPKAAEWRPTVEQIIELPDTEPMRRAFYVGRIVTLAVLL